MKTALLLLITTLYASMCCSQDTSPRYTRLIQKADSLYHAENYTEAGPVYNDAFRANGGKGIVADRYNAACAWAMSDEPDSAFFHLNRIAVKGNYADVAQVTNDPFLRTLHGDQRWESLLGLVKKNKEKMEISLNKPLAALLDSVYKDDQEDRVKAHAIQKTYGPSSREMKELWKIVNVKDSVNLLKVKAILDKYGWLGADEVGERGNSTLFLVIQHADKSTQEKYLPMMRAAVKNGKARPGHLALLEDRLALDQGKRQLYGSQIGQDIVTLQYYVSPLADPDHVDERRAQVGLQPLAEYVKTWDIRWNVEQYKKELPALEGKLKKEGR